MSSRSDLALGFHPESRLEERLRHLADLFLRFPGGPYRTFPMRVRDLAEGILSVDLNISVSILVIHCESSVSSDLPSTTMSYRWPAQTLRESVLYDSV